MPQLPRYSGYVVVKANVKEYLTPVPVPADDSIEDILLKAAYADFLEATGITPKDPDEFRVTVVLGYERLLEHINVHRYYRGIDTGRDVSWEEAPAA